jgi:hypothetical protein
MWFVRILLFELLDSLVEKRGDFSVLKQEGGDESRSHSPQGDG